MSGEHPNAGMDRILAESLRRLPKDYADAPEAIHYEADSILCQALRDLGLRTAVEEFKKLPKWYAKWFTWMDYERSGWLYKLLIRLAFLVKRKRRDENGRILE